MLKKLYTDAPDYRLLTQIIEDLRAGEVYIVPTYTGYAFCCDALQGRSMEQICSLKKIDPKKKALSLLFRDLSQVAEYCKMNDRVFRFMREHKGNYTFILPVASSLPKLLKSRKEVGVRLVQHPLTKLLIEELGNPLMVSSLPVDEDEPEYATNPELVDERYGKLVSCVLDGGISGLGASTVINCTQEPFEVVRLGVGEISKDDL